MGCRKDKRAAEMIALDFRPFSIVNDEGFIRLFRTALPKYKLPSRTYLSENRIPQMSVKAMPQLPSLAHLCKELKRFWKERQVLEQEL
ncbi:unnamed protein product [Darwinula stevensoni]|uniref:Uncharacterized protein n=1 Tax=Darwinula stevensoni TaxID=69355 RepID=A0A7R9ACX4_9CRUS|nr:unnamed protein product [Darwinula stevensoni]CAG0900443.1 unnamed protein product [Darwinula stevensoni]